MIRIEKHMDNHDLYEQVQSAYRVYYSTETTVMKIHNDIVSSLDIGQCAVVSFLDLSDSFDTVDHCIFIKKDTLNHGTALQWFIFYLLSSHYKVSIRDFLSEAHIIDCGAP